MLANNINQAYKDSELCCLNSSNSPPKFCRQIALLEMVGFGRSHIPSTFNLVSIFVF